MLLVAHPAFGQDVQHVGADDLAHLLLADVLGVLGRDHHRRGADRPAVDVAQADLALGVGTQLRLGAGMARLGEAVQDGVGEVDRRRHQRVGLGAGIAEHDALVARALVLVAGGVDADRDVGRLLVDEDLDVRGLPVESVLLVADVPHRIPGDVLDRGVIDVVRSAHLARDDDAVGRAERLHRHARLRVGRQEGVDDGVGNPVADLVRMTFRHGFAGEDIVPLGHQPRPFHNPNTLQPGCKQPDLAVGLWQGSRPRSSDPLTRPRNRPQRAFTVAGTAPLVAPAPSRADRYRRPGGGNRWGEPVGGTGRGSRRPLGRIGGAAQRAASAFAGAAGRGTGVSIGRLSRVAITARSISRTLRRASGSSTALNRRITSSVSRLVVIAGS